MSLKKQIRSTPAGWNDNRVKHRIRLQLPSTVSDSAQSAINIGACLARTTPIFDEPHMGGLKAPKFITLTSRGTRLLGHV